MPLFRVAAVCLILLSACGKSKHEQRAAYARQQAADKARVAEKLRPYESAFAKAVKAFPSLEAAKTAKRCDGEALRKGVGTAGDTRALPLSWHVASLLAGSGDGGKTTPINKYERYLGSGGLDFKGPMAKLSIHQLKKLEKRLESVKAASYLAMIRLHAVRDGVVRDGGFIPGAVQGVVAIVDKASGNLLCYASFQATNSSSVTYHKYKKDSKKQTRSMQEHGVDQDLDQNTKKAIDSAVKRITGNTLTYDANHLLNPAHIVKLK